MKFIKNWKEKVTEGDRFRSLYSKGSMIRIIRKFYRNDDGSVPLWSKLRKLKLYALRKIWKSKAPSNIFSEFTNR